MRKPQLHASHLNMLAKCGIQFQRRYGKTFGVGDKNEILPPSTPLAIGTAVHTSVELNLKRKMDGKETTLDHVEAIARDKFAEQWEDGLLLSEDETIQEKTIAQTVLDASIDTSVALAGLHWSQVAPGIQPVAVEKKFVLGMNNFPFDLAGTIDVIEADGIRDLKTSATKPNSGILRSVQNSMYSYARKAETGKLPEKFTMDFLVKTKTPKVVTISNVPDETMISTLKARIERAAEIIEAVKSGRQAFSPAFDDSWVCTARYCGYARTCKFWSGR